MRNWFLAAGVVALLCGSMAEAGPFRDRLKARMGERQTEGRRWENREGRVVPGGREYAYGSDPLQKLDFWAGAVRDAPLVIFVHGGYWLAFDRRGWSHLAAGAVALALVPAGPVLAANLRKALVGEAPQAAYRPRRHSLYLINTLVNKLIQVLVKLIHVNVSTFNAKLFLNFFIH